MIIIVFKLSSLDIWLPNLAVLDSTRLDSTRLDSIRSAVLGYTPVIPGICSTGKYSIIE